MTKGTVLFDTFMKYIFLDIDGVLNNSRTKTRTPEGYVGISDGLTKRLRRIIQTTGAAVVLTSTWETAAEGEDQLYMNRKLKRFGAKPVDKTVEPDENLFQRGAGIREFLKVNPCDAFVILDDFDFDFAEERLMEHLVLTDPADGLTEEDADRAIRILNGELSAVDPAEDREWGYHR